MTSDVVRGSDGLNRCHWSAQTERYARYHDDEWGRPTRDDRWLFEKLCLEGFQSGLSWLTILNKRENFRTAFANFEVERVAAFGPDDVERSSSAANSAPSRASSGSSSPRLMSRPP